MAKLNHTQIVVLNVTLFLVGLVIVIGGLAIKQPILSGVLEAFGTTLAVTGSITLLDRLLQEKSIGPELIVQQRLRIPRSIHDKKEHATKVDMLGISLTDFLAEQADDHKCDLLQNVIHKPGARVRVMFMHPGSFFLLQRAHEDGDRQLPRLNQNLERLMKRQMASIRHCIHIYSNLMKEYNEA